MSEIPDRSEIYRTAILAEIPRVLGLMDREPYSPTLGSCDRVNWAWKFTDFPGARFQEALCVLSFVYTREFEGNLYRQNPMLLESICGGLKYWASIQYTDGSFDEAYPYERSLAATAFTTFYIGEALNFLKDELPEDVRSTTINAMRNAGIWLCKNDETHGFLSNHLAAASAALYHVYTLTGETQFDRRCRYYLDRILSHQSSEGWYDEYGGADPGYQTHGSFYLARLFQMSGDESLARSIDQSMEFISNFIHVDRSIGGEYASRNTQTYYPAAFEIFAGRTSTASWIAEFMRPGVCSGSAADLRSIDSYNYFPFLNNMVFAWLACSAQSSESLPEPKEPSPARRLTWYPRAGIAKIRTEHYDAFVGTVKGGVIKVFDRCENSLIYSDCGYIGKLHSGKLITSQYMEQARDLSVDEKEIHICGSFVEIPKPVMNTTRFIGFRVFMLTLGRFPALAQWLKRYLVKVLIYRKRSVNINFSRTITFSDQSITISDNLSGPDGTQVSSMKRGSRFSTIHMGSSRYYINNELSEFAMQGNKPVDCSKLVSGTTLTHTVSFK